MIFNEIDPFCSEWLRKLYPNATVLETDVRSLSELDDPRVHLFAGIGGWEYALELAQWPEAWPVWTGSCPCQPFSAAGQHKGPKDPRHLWPEFKRLVEECHPPTIFGEQVASRAGREWLSGVFADLEALGYAVAGADLCAASVGAPHIRQRLFWVALSEGHRLGKTGLESVAGGRQCPIGPNDFDVVVGVAHPDNQRSQGRSLNTGEHTNQLSSWTPSESRGLADGVGQRNENARPGETNSSTDRVQGGDQKRQRLWPNPWECSDALHCRDERWRRVETGSFPLAHGIPARVGRLRAYGNAIVPQVAATFIKSVLEMIA